jgi:hypothetical protein
MKNPVSFLARVGFLSESRMLELYPPFFFMGLRVISVAADYRSCHIRVPLRWHLKNHHGTFFGGALCAVADPMPALLCGRIFPGSRIWSQRVAVEFLVPARAAVNMKIQIPDESVERIRDQLQRSGAAQEKFHFSFWSDDEKELARVENSVFVKAVKKRRE